MTDTFDVFVAKPSDLTMITEAELARLRAIEAAAREVNDGKHEHLHWGWIVEWDSMNALAAALAEPTP